MRRNPRVSMRSTVLALALVVGTAIPALGESTQDSLDRARARLEQLRRATDSTTARYEAALQRLARLDEQIRNTQSAVDQMNAQATSLRKEVVRQAVAAYVGADRDGIGASVLEQADVMDSVRATIFTGSAAERTRDAGDALGSLLDDVRARERELRSAKSEQTSVTADLERQQENLEQDLAEAAVLEQRLEARLTAEQAAAREAARRLAAQRAASQGGGGSSSGDDSGGGGVIVGPSPGGGQLGVEVCPIVGPLSFVDSWHAPRSGGRLHMGVDLMTPLGAPNVAVTSGTVSRGEGSLQGLGVFLYGDNGNTYYYFHLSRYGAAGRVAAGQVIGYSGNTGNAVGGPVHTHFEIHPGGGPAVNPTAAVAAAC